MRNVKWLMLAGLAVTAAGCVEANGYPTTSGYGYGYSSDYYYSRPSYYYPRPGYAYYRPTYYYRQPSYRYVPIAGPPSHHYKHRHHHRWHRHKRHW